MKETGTRKILLRAGGAFGLILIAAALLAIGALAALHLKARAVTVNAEYPYFYYGGTRAEMSMLGDAMLARRPYSGKIFLIDSSGRRAEVYRGYPARRFKLFPVMEEDYVMAARGPDGALWLLQNPSTSTARLLLGGMDGFKEQAAFALPDACYLRLLAGRKPGLARYVSGDGDYFAGLPYSGKALAWEKKCASGPDCDYERKKAEEETPKALLKGETLAYGRDRWHVPGAENNYKGAPFRGLPLKDGAVFFLPAKAKNGAFTYLCRTGSAPQPAWQGFPHDGMPLPHNGAKIWKTPGGAIWWRTNAHGNHAADRPGAAGHVYLIANEEGKALPPVKLSRAMLDRVGGAEEWNLVLLRASGDALWFNLNGKYLAKVSAADPDRFELWALPKISEKKEHFSEGAGSSGYAQAVKAVSGGVMIAALDGVHFMDWEGRRKKLY